MCCVFRYNKKPAAISLRGKMIDAPIVQRAKIVLDAAREIGGLLDE